MSRLTSDQIGDIEFALESRDWRAELSRCDRGALLALVAAARANAKLVEALQLVQRGMRSGKIKDQSILPRTRPTDTSIEPIALSSFIDAALAATGVKP